MCRVRVSTLPLAKPVLRSRHVIPKCGHLAGRIARSHVTNARVIKLLKLLDSASAIRIPNVGRPDSRTTRPSTLIVSTFLPPLNRGVWFFSFVKDPPTREQIHKSSFQILRSVMLILFFSCSSCLTGKPVLIIGLNPARNFPFLTNVISKLLTVPWGCLFLNVGCESDVLSKWFRIMSLTAVDSFALISQTPRLTPENSFDLRQISYNE